MAHQTNITQVGKEIPAQELPEQVKDPVCGATLERKRVRHMLFRPEETFYFCSKDCQQKLQARGFRRERSAA